MLAVLLDADESEVLHLELLTTHAAYQGPPPASWGSTLPCDPVCPSMPPPPYPTSERPAAE